MADFLEDELIDGIKISWGGDSPRLVSLEFAYTDSRLRTIDNLLAFADWHDVLFLAEGVASRSGRGLDRGGFDYPDNDDPEDDVPVGAIEINDYYGSVILGEAVFTSMMYRYFRTLITGARDTDATVIHETWWPRFVSITDQIADQTDS